MDFDIFLTSPRWDILKIISEKPSSPVEIAEKLNTTVSYVSQQLKLLDAANLLKKEKTGEVLKGKPRTLFSLANEFFYLTILTKNISEKRLVPVNDHHKAILNIWLLKDTSLHYYFEKFYWRLEDELDILNGLFIENSGNKPRIIIVSDSKNIKTKVESIYKTLNKEIDYLIIQKDKIKNFTIDFLIPIYDPLNMLQDLKGGYKKNDG
jgi:predicted transcriptional regulator